MDHYFSTDPNLPHAVRTIHYSPKGGVNLTFVTDAGVFSRHRVDYGSHVLIHALPPLAGRILDLGCGYGPIGISLARLNPEAQVLMVDTNKRAVALAQKNIRTNGIANASALVGDGFAAVEGLFAAIVSNPPIRAGKKVIYPLFAQSKGFLAPGGSLWLVIQKKQGAASAVARLQEIFGNCTVTEKSRGYWVLRSVNNP